ncbi:hypothetical protein NDU88_001340 [Pleurodeles waltl]|uniref:Uncharacterized protein n=1 Tax=Pleurodeles waltl TaxID=8319 RepID=A0AAV7P6I1_PLEWA|nr:hypothetical protein NDU88_001340 [Pleurodeles waltl]
MQKSFQLMTSQRRPKAARGGGAMETGQKTGRKPTATLQESERRIDQVEVAFRLRYLWGCGSTHRARSRPHEQ